MPAAAAAVSSSSRPARSRRSVLRWVAVLSSLAFAGFLAMFSLDEPVLSIGFVMHNIPTLVVLIGVALAWHRAWMGAAWMAAALFAALAWFPPLRDRLDWFLAIDAPLIAITVMLAIDQWRSSRR